MSNLAKIYTQLVSLQLEEKLPEESLTAGQKELTLNWLNSTVTQNLFKDIKQLEDKLLEHCIALANTTTTTNTQLILQLLVRVDTLRKLREEYGKVE